MDPVTHTVELVGGHVDKNGAKHTRVIFGKRIGAKDLIRLDEDPQAGNPTQYNDLIVRAHITEFGTLTMPIPLSVLLDLDSVDREDLVAGCNVYQAMSAEGRGGEFLGDNKVKLGWGFIVNDVVYSHIHFGRRVTGRDEIEADRLDLKAGIRRMCFMVGRQIISISSEDGTAQIDGPIPLEYFESLDGADVATLRGAAELWRQTFRIGGAQVSRNGTGATGVVDSNRDQGVERASDSGSAIRAT